MSVKPRQRCPDVDLPLVGGGRYVLASRRPPSFSMLVFYRGLHCPACKSYLRELDGQIAAFDVQGVDVVAISMDGRARAEEARREWALERVAVAYDLAARQAQEWGLYLSAAIRDAEPAQFSEPGLFLVRPDGVLYCAWIQSVPFARPALADVLKGVAFVKERAYPARGELTAAAAAGDAPGTARR